ncbi:MAG: heparinase II/III family protein [Bacteroidales bacterium]|nr:heparinase II/III family protein [Bacteroidales bacterium]
MKKLFLFALLLVMALQGSAYTERNILQAKATEAQLKQMLIPNQKWVSYPAYTDRAGWDRMFGSWKAGFISQGEVALEHQWTTVKATDFLEFERTGNRTVMQTPYFKNRTALTNLLMAELAEGQGRFIDQLINGVFYHCEMTTWALSAHTVVQSSRRSLPTLGEDVFDLYAGDMGTLLAWTYYFFRDSFDKVDPEISRRLRYELQHRLLDPYMKGGFGWMAENFIEGESTVNNWNPWCNFNALACFMLLENDMDVLAKGVYKTMVSVDKFINYSQVDGACEEGPHYWTAAGGMMYDYLQLLYKATGSKLSVFDDSQVRNMGEYIAHSYVEDGWVVNFADNRARGGVDPALVYRFGKAVGSSLMMGYAKHLYKAFPQGLPASSYITRDFETLEQHAGFFACDLQRQVHPCVWYPLTQFCYIRDARQGVMLAAKGGYNAESHNHNDVGSFIFYKHNTPVLIDAGLVTYTRQTFSTERYSIWAMQSDYHNLPRINGVSQHEGREYRASDVWCNGKNLFSLDIAGAYPAEADVKSWTRTYKLQKGVLRITDKFSLGSVKAANQINFLTWGEVDASVSGKLRLRVADTETVLQYDDNQFEVRIEPFQIDDPTMTTIWGDKLCRISLEAKHQVLQDTYRFVFE